MHRRRFLAAASSASVGATAGCLERLPVIGSGVSTDFELESTGYDIDDEPAVTIDGETVVAEGTVQYGSSKCGTVELAHAAYEDSQDRLDVLVVAADDSGFTMACTDDLVASGYRLEATVSGRLRRVSVTEHHVFGETYSTTASENG
ncbi:hypothetical protein [Natronolimnobius baerhuensis]|uniref:Uncharacterized protein n=1 Tax=Natronolimnobius baerhuensis TaxID=253108 RepID=A0A202E866_9EURY|nr:hypothetical protein [Natronolimnobius baerhuensis]OVE84150.1 hypothetical protein B2G88_06920 [Natronolimnobius baerhuensis]